MNAIKDKTPILILIFAALVGVASGLASICFKKAEDWVALERISLASHFHNIWLMAIISGLISMILGGIAYFLVCRYSPEAGGSGIPEIEGALENVRPVRWWRVIPVKFLGGICSLGSGMLLGREGPTVQLCANIAKMLLDIFRIKDKESQHVLLAAGAAAGLSAAFNAPLAGVLFIIEEMRPQFRYSLISIKAIMVGVILSTIVFRAFNGQDGVISMQTFSHIPLETLWLYLLLGIIFGIFGVWFNYAILFAQKKFEQYHQGQWQRFVQIGLILGGICGIANIIFPEISGGGFELITNMSHHHYAFSFIFCVFIIRVLLTVLCFSSGAPGGIFAPMLALGTLFGTLFGLATSHLFPNLSVIPTTYAIAGMGALFAASVGAPLTGIILVLEMTSNYQLILPMIITCLGATMSAQVLGGRPLYSTILERTLKKARLKNSDTKNPINTAPIQTESQLNVVTLEDDLPICESLSNPVHAVSTQNTSESSSESASFEHSTSENITKSNTI